MHAEPILAVHVRRFVSPFIMIPQIKYSVRLALHVDDVAFIKVNQGKHVITDIKHQHALASSHLSKRELFLDGL